MKVAVLILVILGSLLSLGLGIKYMSDYNKAKAVFAFAEQVQKQAQDSQMDAALKAVKKAKYAGIAMIVMGLLSLAALFLKAKLGKIAPIIYIAAAVIPAIFVPETLIFTFLLIIAGILAFLEKPQQA